MKQAIVTTRVNMKRIKFKQMLSELKDLTYNQKQELIEKIKIVKPKNKVLALGDKPNSCRHCQSEQYVKWGNESGIQRYKCKSCKKTYNQLTNTSLARLRKKEEWLSNANEMIKGSSLKTTGEICNIAISTAFHWRHKFLELLGGIKPDSLSGIVEADETYFLESRKGQRSVENPRKRGGKAKKRGLSSEQIPVLIARDRSKNTLSCQLESVSSRSISDTLADVMEKGSVLCTDGNPVYPSVANEYGALHKKLNIKSGLRLVEKIYHIQNVNSYTSRLKSWMKRFHGVSTKYLQKYLGWWRMIDTFQNLSPISFLYESIGIKCTNQRLMLI